MDPGADPTKSEPSAAAIVKARISNLKCSKLARKTWWKKPFYIKISLEGQPPFQTAFVKGDSELSWSDVYTFKTSSSFSIRVQLLEHHILHKTKEIGEVSVDLQTLLGGNSIGRAFHSRWISSINHLPLSEVSLQLRKPEKVGGPEALPTFISFTMSILGDGADVVLLREGEAIMQARASLENMSVVPSALSKTQAASSMSSETLNSAKSLVDIWGSVLDKIELFAKIADQISAIIIAQKQRDDLVFRLMETIDDVHSFLTDAEPTETIKTHREILEDISALTVECAYLIRDYTVDKEFWTRIAHLTLAGVESRIQQYDEKFKELKARFNERAIVRIDIMLLRCLEQVQSIQNKAVTLIINDLPYADGGGFDPDKACIPGTRVFVLDELHRWINERDSDDVPRLLVLTGVPGFGKSAISNTLAQHYRKVKRLGSFVSFSRADQVRRHPGNLLSTISRDIADLDPHWRLALCAVVESDHSLAKGTSPMRQMEDLVLEPAKALTITGPIVIIIDALDESGSPAERESLLRVLSQYASALPRNFRVLVTARPEKDIVKSFSDNSDNQPHIQQKRLDTMDLATIDLDIAVYIERQLSPLLDAFDQEWLFREQWLGMLVTGSDHVFQWAATTCRAILEAEEYGVGYVTSLIAEIAKAGENLDALYKLILQRKFPERDTVAVSRFKRVLGCVLAAKAPLFKRDLMDLCCEEADKTRFESVLTPLGSLLNGVSGDSPIVARHTSFFDFLTDQDRSLAYSIDPTQYSQYFVKPCLRLLSSGLRFNICELPSSYTPNTVLADLADRVTKHITPVLGYASHFLGQHLKYTPYDQAVLEGLRALLKEHFLHWLEVLSLLKQISAASKLFASIHAWVQAHDVNFSAFVKDMIRFVETFAAPISQSVPHIYLSALPFAPSQSLVSQTYLPQYSSTAHLKVGKLDRWPAMLKTFEGHTSAVWAAAYSPDGTRIASASADSTIRVWDTETGEAVGAPFKGHTAAIRSIAYSPSGHRIVSGSDDSTIMMWDSETGEAARSPLQHSGTIACVAYSRDGKHVVSGSYDGTICMWDAETGEAASTPVKGIFFAHSPNGSHMVSTQNTTLCGWDVATGEAVGEPLEGHSDYVDCVVYSPDGTLIASCSSDHTIRLWDAEARQAVRVLEGHTDLVVSVAFSPDGAHLASGSDDKTMRVWDVKAGKPAGAPLEGHASAVYSVAYSPDGTHIVSGSEDGTVRVWDAEAVGFDAAGAALQGSSKTFLSMAYSPDGASIVSGSVEGKIQMWDGNTGQPRPILISGHHKDVNDVAFSPDGTRIVSGSDDCTLQVWDVLTGEAVVAPFKGHTKEVLSVGYSPDGLHIISGSFDGTVRTWDVKSGEPLGDPFKQRYVWAVAYSPDGMHIVSGGEDNILRKWNIKTRKQVRALSGHTQHVACVAYSLDGKRIVSGSRDNTLRLWDVESGEAIGSPLLGHDEMIESVDFSPDGKSIVSGSRDKTLRMWDVETMELSGGPVKVHSDWVMSVAYSPDGTRIASASRDNTIRIWDVAHTEASADSDDSAKFRHDCKLENGWIVTASGQLLLWVPPWNRQGLMWPSNVAVVAPSLTELDLADFVHGSDWVSCKSDAKVVGARL
ncbi:hypothetical protein HWV62_8761 [Athelia sp. TMB]|nr:hypothetical protein HWV62_8761 [Athelia sp. TMB]